MTRACVTVWAVAALLAGCGRPALPTRPTPAKDRTELEARYDALRPGATGSEVEAAMGARGAALAGYSTAVVRQKPDGADGAVAAGEADRYWAGGDGASAVRVVFGADGRARLLQLLTITPPPPTPPPPVEPPAP